MTMLINERNITIAGCLLDALREKDNPPLNTEDLYSRAAQYLVRVEPMVSYHDIRNVWSEPLMLTVEHFHRFIDVTTHERAGKFIDEVCSGCKATRETRL